MLRAFTTIVKPAADYGWGSGRRSASGGLSLALLLAFVARRRGP